MRYLFPSRPRPSAWSGWIGMDQLDLNLLHSDGVYNISFQLPRKQNENEKRQKMLGNSTT